MRASRPPRRDVIARASDDPSFAPCVSAPQTIAALLLLRREGEGVMERLDSVRRQRTCVVLAEEDGRFIRQVAPMNGEVGRHACCRAERSARDGGDGGESGYSSGASEGIRLLGSDASVMTRISGVASVSATASDLHSQEVIRPVIAG